MRRRLAIAAFAAILINLAMMSSFVSSVVSAATLQVTQGVVQINRGQGFEPVTGSSPVNPGDVVTVQPGGNAQVVYPDGSIQPVQPGSVATVGPGATAPATAGGQQVLTQAANPSPGAGAGGTAGGGAAGGGAAGGGAGAAAGGLGGLSGTSLVLGAAAVGIGVGAAVYVVQSQNKAASP